VIKLLTLYRHPVDEDTFLRHFHEHLLLVRQIPGITDVIVNHIKADAYGGEPSYFMITEYHFADRESFRDAMKSPENQAAGQHLLKFAQGLVTLLVSETEVMGA
jgi:uncharacterized protein (TIGR02118 family)